VRWSKSRGPLEGKWALAASWHGPPERSGAPENLYNNSGEDSMRTPPILTKVLCLIAMAGACGLSRAQHIDGHDEAARAADRATGVILNESRLIVLAARKKLRSRDFSGVALDCDRAIMLEDSVRFRGDSAHELLAESYFAQGQMQQALKETSIAEGGTRLAMTRALILTKLGRHDDAYALVLAQTGTIDRPVRFREAFAAWELPIDRGSDDDYLLATAYVVRATSNETDQKDDWKDDFEAAVKLAPRSASVELVYGGALAVRYPKEAIPHLEKSLASGRDKRTIERAKALMQTARDVLAHQKTGG
jgi:tetratricopeptide (TPR) repeat protein